MCRLAEGREMHRRDAKAETPPPMNPDGPGP